MKKIISLITVFIKEYYQNLPIFDTVKRKFNKKSIFFWLVAIIFFGVSYLSYDIINFLKEIGQKEIFLSAYFPILALLLAFQTILSCANVFFFSKDIEKVLHMPIKPVELLISKFATLLSMLYGTEAVFTVSPLVIYGIMTSSNFVYYLWALLIIAIFPILIAVVISIIIFIIMRFARFIRNKELFQVVISVFLIIAIFIVEFIITNNIFEVDNNKQVTENLVTFNDKIQDMNQLFLIVNPTIDILTNTISIDSLISVIKIIVYNIIGILVFILIGKSTYLKDIIKNIISTDKKNKRRLLKIKKISQSKNISKSYVTKEIKLLVRQPVFFMQCIFPVILLLISGIILVVSVLPAILKAIQDEQVMEALKNFSINTEIVCDILIVLQVLFSISNISLTAISRDGNNATFIKYIPIDLYSQFIYKNIPQFILNLLISIVVLGLFWYIIPHINLGYLLLIFAISIIINMINCYLMLIVDLRRPNIDWSTEEAVVKKSDNKIFQYTLLIANVLFLLYIANIFKGIDIIIAMLIEVFIYIVIFVILDRCVNRWKVKLFNKII